MFDYQAGEKYKLTLIMVAIAGAMAGMFFTVLLMPTPEAPQARKRQQQPWMNNPDVTGRASGAGAAQATTNVAAEQAAAAQPAIKTDPILAQTLVEKWLPFAFDLTAGSASGSQEKAIACMSAECAQSYRENVWTPDVAKTINESGIKSNFRATKITAGAHQTDGSLVITVEGEQILAIPDQPSKQRNVKFEYLLKQTPDGMKICGISDLNKGG
ncbi:MAG: hypothetical protein IAF58_21415 [Leptolyngbya sp.]|nr:hypothetical protein [Candidatus Melainabacteria bacterium]